MKADMMDYQQYKTGDRLEGFIEQGGVLLGSIVTLATGYFLPVVFWDLLPLNLYSKVSGETISVECSGWSRQKYF